MHQIKISIKQVFTTNIHDNNNNNNNNLKGLEAKGPFSCLGLQTRFKRAYQTLINYSFLWLVKYYLNNSINYFRNNI